MAVSALTPYILIGILIIGLALVSTGALAEDKLKNYSNRTNFIFALAATVLAFVTLWLTEKDKSQSAIIETLTGIASSQESLNKTQKELNVKTDSTISNLSKIIHRHDTAIENQKKQLAFEEISTSVLKEQLLLQKLVMANNRIDSLIRYTEAERDFRSMFSRLSLIFSDIVYRNYPTDSVLLTPEYQSFLIDQLDRADRLVSELIPNIFLQKNRKIRRLIVGFKTCIDIMRMRLNGSIIEKACPTELKEKWSVMLLIQRSMSLVGNDVLDDETLIPESMDKEIWQYKQCQY